MYIHEHLNWRWSHQHSNSLRAAVFENTERNCDSTHRLLERTLDQRWLEVGSELVTVAVRRSFDARRGTRLTPSEAFRAGSEPAASDRVHWGIECRAAWKRSACRSSFSRWCLL